MCRALKAERSAKMDRGDLLLLAALAIALFTMGWWTGHTGFFDTQDNGVYYIEYHLEDVEEGGVKRYKDWSSDWVEPPFSVGDTVYKFGSFSITKNKRYSEQLCRETGIPEKQYVIVKIK